MTGSHLAILIMYMKLETFDLFGKYLVSLVDRFGDPSVLTPSSVDLTTKINSSVMWAPNSLFWLWFLKECQNVNEIRRGVYVSKPENGKHDKNIKVNCDMGQCSNIRNNWRPQISINFWFALTPIYTHPTTPCDISTKYLSNFLNMIPQNSYSI